VLIIEAVGNMNSSGAVQGRYSAVVCASLGQMKIPEVAVSCDAIRGVISDCNST
jgi:hypothetical protein